jgi:hypothetical protein
MKHKIESKDTDYPCLRHLHSYCLMILYRLCLCTWGFSSGHDRQHSMTSPDQVSLILVVPPTWDCSLSSNRMIHLSQDHQFGSQQNTARTTSYQCSVNQGRGGGASCSLSSHLITGDNYQHAGITLCVLSSVR